MYVVDGDIFGLGWDLRIEKRVRKGLVKGRRGDVGGLIAGLRSLI